jgi:ATP-dependent Clp protease ATP-binding subunit ClpA
MFERFSSGARSVVILANQEAHNRGDTHIGTEHLVIALAGHEQGRAAFDAVGLDADSLRTALDELYAGALETVGIRTGGTPPRPPMGPRHIRFTSGAKDALEQSLRLVVAEGERSISLRHIGLIVSSRGPRDQATMLLHAAGVEPDVLRRAFERP